MKVLIADDIHENMFALLTNIGLSFSYLPHLKRSEILEIIADYEGLIIRSKTKIDKEFLDKAVNLKFIARAGAGLDLIDVEGAKAKNIAIFAANEGNKDAVAEHVIAMLLNLFAKINLADAQVKNYQWDREGNRGIELMGKTVAIIGYGNNGKATAQRLIGFGVKVLAHDPYKTVDGIFAHDASMQQIFEQTDILSIHVPLNKETNHLINEKFINQFEKPFYFINISRGEIVVQSDLIKALQNQKILGACLDVLENEKINELKGLQRIEFEILSKMPNVILSPHIAGWTFESYKKINQVLFEKIKHYLLL